jgi:hypothetical protein
VPHADPPLGAGAPREHHRRRAAGTAAFTGAPGELRYDVAGADLILRGTIAGTTPAFEIRLAGLGTLAAGDITL